jgi:hypothetical protein
MVAKADLVVLVLDEEDAEGGYSGTYHLYEKALEIDRPVYGWLATGIRWGEHDPEGQYAHLFV